METTQFEERKKCTNLGVQLKSREKKRAAQKCLFGMDLGNFRFYIYTKIPASQVFLDDNAQLLGIILAGARLPLSLFK